MPARTKPALVYPIAKCVPFHLPANVKYVCDFLCFWQDDTVTVEDVKGIKMPMYVLKKKQVEAIYPIKIMEV